MSSHHYEYAYPVPLPCNRDTAFRALTEQEALSNWFAEHVEIDPREGGAYRFWGRYTMGCPGEPEATQSITRFDPGSRLSYSWRLLGCDSEVSVLLAGGEMKDTTMVTVRHDFDKLPEISRAEALIDDLWRIHTGQLYMYLHGEDEIFRPDFSGEKPEIRCDIVIEAPPEKVFAALITPESISQWFPAPAPVVEPRVGGKYGFGYSYEMDGKTVEPPPMTIREFEENRKLSMNWPDWRGDPAVPDQAITWLLEDLGGRTRLTLVHDGFVRPVDVSDYPFGWQEFLGQIRGVALKA